MSDDLMDEPRRGGRPRVVDTPEFQTAVESAVADKIAELLPDLMARLALAQAAAGVAPQADSAKFAESLALQLAQLTSQNSGLAYVAPEILESRRLAHERMVDLLLEFHARREVPLYRLKNKVFLNLGGGLGEAVIDPLYRDNTKILRVQEMGWPSIPNLAMEPVNDSARQVFAEFCASISHSGAVKAPDRLFVLSAEGGVLKGDMNAILAREAALADNQFADPGHNPEAPAATLKRRDEAPKQRVNILGTLAKPVEVM